MVDRKLKGLSLGEGEEEEWVYGDEEEAVISTGHRKVLSHSQLKHKTEVFDMTGMNASQTGCLSEGPTVRPLVSDLEHHQEEVGR